MIKFALPLRVLALLTGLAVTPALELYRAITEAKQGGEVLPLLLVDVDQLLRFIRGLGQQPPLDHLLHIGAG